MAGSPLPDPNVIASVSNAIAAAEGYGANSTNLPTRSNNPGDIGNTGSATQGYPTPEAGWAALDNQVALMFSGNGSHYQPTMTLTQIGAIYAKNPDGTPNTAWPKNVAAQLGVSPNTTLAQIASGSVTVKALPRPYASGSSDPSGTDSNAFPYLTDDSDPAVAVPVSGMGVDPSQVAALLDAISPSLIINTGLDQPSWEDDPTINHSNRLQDLQGDPVTFQLFFNLPQDLLPVVVTLNASMKSFQKQMRHLTNRQRTLTGYLVNLWGSQCDQITGQASTGLFTNQLGITDFLSLSTVPADVQQAIFQAFDGVNHDQTVTDIFENQIETTDGFLRIAAKDAFVELLSLFRNNGTVWFRNQNYTGYTSGKEQMSVDAWSPQTGSTTFQNAARRNDVMTRGKVVMYFRNTVYYGFFKTLNWTIDAETPYRWNFNFVFQVENSITNVTVPQS